MIDAHRQLCQPCVVKNADQAAGQGTPIQRVALHERAVAALRTGISQGRWHDQLPSEAELCRELQISRMTLRKSLQQLAQEKWLTLGGRGRHHRLCARPSSARKASGKIVRILTPYTLFTMGSLHLLIMEGLRERLGREGYSVEFEVHPKLFGGNSLAGLRRLDQLPDTAGWVLFASTEAIQRWFVERRRPCVVVGPLFAGIALPSVFPDTMASARHAVGLFRSRGHRELAYFMRDFTTLGDRLGEVAFAEEGRRTGVHVRTVTHTADPIDLRRRITQELLGDPRPTAFFSNCAEDALTILCHLQNAGIAIPREAAVLAGWADMTLHHAVPTIACYRINGEKAGRKAARLLLDLLQGAPLGLHSRAIIPDFISGESV